MTAISPIDLMLYGSGDAGTRELIEHLNRKRVAFLFLDVRDSWKGQESLKFILERRHSTVPQLYSIKDGLIGDYEAACLHVETLPEPAAHSPSPSYA